MRKEKVRCYYGKRRGRVKRSSGKEEEEEDLRERKEGGRGEEGERARDTITTPGKWKAGERTYT